MSNYAKVIMASNDDWVVPADIDDRRFAVFKVAEERKQDETYFAALNKELANGGLAAMLHDLLAMPLGDWHPRRDIPQTKERNIQKAASLVGFEALFLDMLREGETVVQRWVTDEEPFVATSELTEFAQRRLRREDMTFNKVSTLFRKLGFIKDDRARPRGLCCQHWRGPAKLGTKRLRKSLGRNGQLGVHRSQASPNRCSLLIGGSLHRYRLTDHRPQETLLGQRSASCNH